MSLTGTKLVGDNPERGRVENDYYEIYPETLADWFSHQPIEEQALFLSNFLSQLDENRMTELSKEFAQYRYCSKLVVNDLDKFAKKAKEIVEGENND